MRHHSKQAAALIACALLLAACSRSASIGIPTPEQATQNFNTPAPADTLPPATSAPQLPEATSAPDATPRSPQPVATVTLQAPQPTDTLPAPTETVPPAIVDNTPATVTCGQLVTYVVKAGDNLFRIGLRYQTTAYAIARRNSLPSVRVVRTGATLRILTCGK